MRLHMTNHTASDRWGARYAINDMIAIHLRNGAPDKKVLPRAAWLRWSVVVLLSEKRVVAFLRQYLKEKGNMCVDVKAYGGKGAI